MNIEEQGVPWFVGNAGIEAYLSADHFVVLDFETTNIQMGDATHPDNSIVLACWYVVKNGTVEKKHKFGNEYQLNELVQDVQAAQFTIAHNAQFELAWLSRCGLDLRTVLVYDTMVAEWVIHGNITVPYNLEATALRHKLDGKESLVSKMIKLGICPSTIPQSWLLRYCYKDVQLCLDLFWKQYKIISNKDLWHIVLSRNLVIPVLSDMTLGGLEVDPDAVNAAYEEQAEIKESLGEKLDKITGGINLNSPKQLSKFLYETLGFKRVRDRNGELSNSTAEDIIFQLKATTEEQKEFLRLYKDYNQANTLLSKTLSFLKGVVDNMKGRFYGRVVQCRTATHRLAGAGIKVTFPGDKKERSFQLQNIPRQFKKLFTAHEEDWEVTEFDGAGQEFRVATILGRDKQGEYDIVNGVDVHAFTRDTMNAAYQRYKIGKEIDRQEAKSSTFTPLFWGKGKDPAEEEYAIAFAEKYSGIREAQQDWVNEVTNTKQLVTDYGMIYYWPNARMYESGWLNVTTELVNIPIQGLATAECIPIALVHFWHKSKHLRCQLFNTVHDSGVVRNHKDDREAVYQIAKVAMTTDVYNFLREVYGYETGTCPLGVGFKSGKHWGVSDEEWIYDVWADGNERLTKEVKKVKTVVYDTRGNAA